MATPAHAIGAQVRFKPGPRSASSVTGKVTGALVDGFQTVQVEGRDAPYKVRPGSATAI